MSKTGVMGQPLPERVQVKEGQEFGPVLTDERGDGARWFREAVGTYEVQKEAADHIGVDPAYLKRMCDGTKPVGFDHLARMKRLHLVGYQRAIEAMAIDGKMVVVSTNEIHTTAEQRVVLLSMRELLGEMWPAYRDKIAARVFRCGGDLLDHALNYEAQRK